LPTTVTTTVTTTSLKPFTRIETVTRRIPASCPLSPASAQSRNTMVPSFEGRLYTHGRLVTGKLVGPSYVGWTPGIQRQVDIAWWRVGRWIEAW
jgi:hypothetical protein